MNSKFSLLRASALTFLVSHTWLHAAVIFGNEGTPPPALEIHSRIWWGQSFEVDAANPTAENNLYTLTSVELGMGDASDPAPAGNFFVRIYDAAPNNTPGNLLATLDGPTDPSVGGINYTYNSVGGPLILTPHAIYYVVAGIDNDSETGNYVWNAGDSSSIGTGSGIGLSFLDFGSGPQPDPGATWSDPIPELAFNLRVNADVTPVPEPANMALGIFGVLLVGVQSFRWWNARRMQMDRLASR